VPYCDTHHFRGLAKGTHNRLTVGANARRLICFDREQAGTSLKVLLATQGLSTSAEMGKRF
jgi:hypothetical protein